MRRYTLPTAADATSKLLAVVIVAHEAIVLEDKREDWGWGVRDSANRSPWGERSRTYHQERHRHCGPEIRMLVLANEQAYAWRGACRVWCSASGVIPCAATSSSGLVVQGQHGGGEAKAGVRSL